MKQFESGNRSIQISAGNNWLRIFLVLFILGSVFIAHLIIPSALEKRDLTIVLYGVIISIPILPFCFDHTLSKKDDTLILNSLFKSHRFDLNEKIDVSMVALIGSQFHLFKLRIRGKSYLVRYYYSELLENWKLDKNRRKFIGSNKLQLVKKELRQKYDLNISIQE